MKQRKLTITLLLLWMLSGCFSTIATPSTPVVPTHTPTAKTLPSIIATVTSSATKAPEADRPNDCIDLTATTFDGTTLDGLLIVWDQSNGTRFLDPRINKILEIGEDHQAFFLIAISPNKQFMLGETAGYYILRTVDKIIKSNIPNNNDWIPDRWLDNEHVEVLTTVKPHDILVWNPFTNDQKRVHLNLPHPETMVQAGGHSVVFAYIDASSERIVFSDQNFNSHDQNGRLILWNLGTLQQIASFPSPAASRSDLSFGWSPGSKEYVTQWPEGWGRNILANELYVWDMDGNQKQLTDLNQRYPFANVEAPVWSPDGRRIAFWLKSSNTGNPDPEQLRQWLAVVDTDTLETKIYCLADGNPERQAHRIVWSPDSRQLIANIELANGDMQATLVDLIHQTQSIIDGTQGLTVKDWMAP